MDRFTSLRIFLRVANTESFTSAAASLRMPRSTVSTAIQTLEAHLGTRLLHRTTRKVSLTRDGTELYERGVRILADLEELETLFRRAKSLPKGKLNIDAPARIARRIIAPALPDFFARYPEIMLTLGATDRAVDFAQEGVDCAIRVGHYQETGAVAKPLGTLELINCASPDYIVHHGMPETLEDLSTHLAVHYASPFTRQIEEWEYVQDGETKTLAINSIVTVNNSESYIACCLAGLGLIQVPAYDVRDHLESRRLVEVLPEWRAEPMPITILYPRHRVSGRLRIFTEWVQDLIAREVLAR